MGEAGSGGPLSGDDAAALSGQIGALARANLPLPSGLRALAAELPRGRLRGVLAALADSLEAGMALDTAIAAQKRRLPAYLGGLVTAGMRTGQLGDVLGRYAGYMSVGTDLRRWLWLRLITPLFSVAFAMAVFIFACVVVASGFSRIFADFGIQVTEFTHMVLDVAAMVARIWKPLVEAFAILLVFWIVSGLVSSWGLGRRFVGTLPLLGSVLKLSALAEFSHLLALLLESEVPLVEALPMAGAAVEHTEIEVRSRNAARDVGRGELLADTLVRCRIYGSGMARIVAWAQDHQGLPEALHMAGEMFEARARSQASLISTVCSVLAVLSVLGGIASAVLAILVPLMVTIRRLSG